MSIRFRSFAFLLSLAFLGAGCDSALDPTPPEAPASAGGPASASVTLNQYTVAYEGRTYDAAGDATTFAYLVSGTGVGPELSHFVVELPECAPAATSYTPPKGAKTGVDPITGIFGLKWHRFVAVDASQRYTITFAGNVVEGTVRVSVQAGPEELRSVEAGTLPGPCNDAANFAIAGTVFDDADTDGAIDEIERGLPDVTVTLEDASGMLQSASTDENGAYRFEGLAAGTYTVRIPAATADEDLNEDLAEFFSHTGSDPSDPSLVVTVGPDSEANHFGFAPIPVDIVEEIVAGTLVTDGENVKFWKDQFEAAIHGGVDEIDGATLLGYLDVIESLHLTEYYQFGTDDRLQAALDFLKHKPDEGEWVELREELLATELNGVRGLGLTGSGGLQSALIAWGEAVLVANEPADTSAATAAAPATVTEASAVFNAINGGGGKTNE